MPTDQAIYFSRLVTIPGTSTFNAVHDRKMSQLLLGAVDHGSSFVHDVTRSLANCQWYFLDMLNVLNESESDIVKSSHLHLSSCWCRATSLVPPSSSSTIFDGFQ
uniref:Uncharacterized protein n=1 Tax=Arundo donax TaxID=35708 RepID=A0A0A8YTP2_ARUDO